MDPSLSISAIKGMLLPECVVITVIGVLTVPLWTSHT